MIRNKDILNSLPLLASILGDQYGVEVRIGGNDAKTNGKVIYLPALPMDSGTELLAQARGFLDHEAAHIRHTNFQAVKEAGMDAVTFNLFNAIEDWRIERRISEIYPGCRQNFHWLIKRLFLENKKDERAGEQTPALSVLKYVLLTVRAWEVPELDERVQNLKQILDANYPGLRTNLDDILARARGFCPDSQAVIGYAHELAECIRNWQPPENQPESNVNERTTEQNQKHDQTGCRDSQDGNSETGRSDKSQGCMKSETDIPQDEDASDSDGPSEYLENENCDSAHSGNDPEQAENMEGTEKSNQHGGNDGNAITGCQSQSEDKNGIGNGLASLFKLGEKDLPQGLGEMLGSSLEQENADCPDIPVTVAVPGELEVDILSEEDIREAMSATIALRTHLTCLLQTEAQKRCQIARRGKLDTTTLYRLSVGNAKVFRKEAKQHGIDTAIHILLDVSGSMYGN